MAFVQYTQDNDETYPCDLNPGQGNGWAGQIYPYVKSAGVYTCPDDPTLPGTEAAGPDTILSYALNHDFYIGDEMHDAGVTPSATNVGISLSTLNAPAVTVELFEVEGIKDDNGQYGILFETTTPHPNTNLLFENHSPSGTAGCDNGGQLRAFGNAGQYATGIVSQATSLKFIAGNTGVHTDASNYLAADGHVKWVRGTQVSGGYNASSAIQQAGVENPFQACGGASGTSKLTNSIGSPVVLTFSPI